MRDSPTEVGNYLPKYALGYQNQGAVNSPTACQPRQQWTHQVQYTVILMQCTKVGTQIFFVSPQIANLQILGLKGLFCNRKSAISEVCNSGKSQILKFEFAEVLSPQYMIGFTKRKKYVVRKSQIRNLKKVRKFADLRFAGLICGPPIFSHATYAVIHHQPFHQK